MSENRRAFLGKTILGAAGLGAACTLEETILLAAIDEGTAEGAKPAPVIAPSEMPCGKIGGISISRLFLGGNLIGGYAHARDLLYVSRLFQAYNTEEKIFETFARAEQCGINTTLLNTACQDLVEKYKRERGGKLQSMICIRPDADEAKTRDQIKQVVDKGATLVYTHGELTDRLTMAGQVDLIGKTIDAIKAEGVPAGVGSHSLETPIACEKNGLAPDFYVKTFHMDRYWSATPEDQREEWCWYKGQGSEPGTYHDNMWCIDPDKTIAFMQAVERPWVAFKVLAAGAIPPRLGFSYAYRSGADFVVAGMFDFQVEEDVKTAVDILRKLDNRDRPWRA